VVARSDLHHRESALDAAEEACRGCHACPLYRKATHAVWGEGPPDASVMLVGEQPGDVEDLKAHPFVGPAGLLLRAVMDDAGLGPDVYLTNAVKHFKFEERGKRRLHKRPSSTEVLACKPWLIQEIAIVRPRVLVALGATAASTLFGSAVSVTRDRGRVLDPRLNKFDQFAGATMVTFHPSAILRAPTHERRSELRQLLRHDLALAARVAARARRTDDEVSAAAR
jgi:uracil-DNA glycosylase family protein